LKRIARHGSRGFTLIEILVVVVIIGVVVSMATLSVNLLGRDSEVEEQARRFWAVLRQTREEAELQGLNIGAYLAAEEYEFLRLDALTNRWVPISDDKLYVTRSLPEGLRYRMWLDGREIVMKPQLPEREDEAEKDEPPTEEEKKEAQLPQALRTVNRDSKRKEQENRPQLVILSNGDVMPFELQIERERQPALWRIVATPDNDLRIEQRRTQSENWQIVAQTNPPLDERAAKAKANARR
jgi:general secretion pathway protein H